MNLMSCQTLVEPVIDLAQRNPDHLSLVFMAEDGSEQRLNAAQVHQAAVVYAQALRARGVKPGDLVILVLPHLLELPLAFWGTLYLGAIPSIFPFLSEKLDPTIYMERVRALVGHSQARAVITAPAFKTTLETLLRGMDCHLLTIDEVSLAQEPGDSHFSQGTPATESIAFLQHSSGTTGLQKGVALSHRAVLNQLAAYSQAIALNSEDVIVSWLPLYHDMGLIAGFMLPLVTGTPLVLMSPFHWIRDPKILLWAIHRQRGTLAWLPNFAYNHCVRSIRRRDLEGLDLSSWRAAINCSEPVRHDSHHLFLERFAPYGFRKEALATCYAMAENTFAVTQSQPGQPPEVDWVQRHPLQHENRAIPLDPTAPEAISVVSCGLPLAGAELVIVDEAGQVLPERHVGEIIIHSNSMLSEYYRRPDLTGQAIHDGWYYTGDMGYLAEGQLYISGRKKDLIIVGGKNIYPQDLEAIANEVPGLYPGRTVAFGVSDERLGSEGIIMVCELAQTPDVTEMKAIESQLRRRIVQDLDVTLTDVRLVDKRWLLKTSSGKIARPANREKYLQEFH
jgi:acyl-CoA synthetase (AMP-forming)/AMP-acid ligase II